MSTLFRRIQRSLPMKISLNMFFVAVLVFLLVIGVFGALSRRHFHAVAMDNASRTLSTATDSARHYLQPLSRESLQILSKALSPLKPYPNSYFMILDKDGGADKCLACGACEAACPQHLNIIDSLASAWSELNA